MKGGGEQFTHEERHLRCGQNMHLTANNGLCVYASRPREDFKETRLFIGTSLMHTGTGMVFKALTLLNCSELNCILAGGGCTPCLLIRGKQGSNDMMISPTSLFVDGE
jgi:hypothetical protein